MAGAAMIAVMVLVLPWLLRGALRFRLHNTSWRGLRFGFTGTVRSAYLTFVLPVLIFLLPGSMGALAIRVDQQAIAPWFALFGLPFLAWPVAHAATDDTVILNDTMAYAILDVAERFDASAMAAMAGVLARAMESAADAYAMAALRARHLPLAPLAELFENLVDDAPGGDEDPGWFSTVTGHVSSRPVPGRRTAAGASGLSARRQRPAGLRRRDPPDLCARPNRPGCGSGPCWGFSHSRSSPCPTKIATPSACTQKKTTRVQVLN